MGLFKGIKIGISCAAILSVLSQRPVLAAPDVGDDAPLYAPPEEFTIYNKIPQPIPDAGFQIEDQNSPKLPDGFYIRYFVGNPPEVLTKISDLEIAGFLNIMTFDRPEGKDVELHLHYSSLDAAVEAIFNLIEKEQRSLEIIQSHEGEIIPVQTFKPFIPPELPLRKSDRLNLAERLMKNPRGVLNELEEYWSGRYSKGGDLNENLRRAVTRSERAIPTIGAFLKNYDVPLDFKFLGIVESHWTWYARSILIKTEYKTVRQKNKTRRVKITTRVPLAVGVHQFIAPTGKAYGLKIYPKLKYDERLNEFLSGEAVARHVSHLLTYFENNSHISMAAYNSGMPLTYKKMNGSNINIDGYFRFLGKNLKKKFPSHKVVDWVWENTNFIARLMAIIRVSETEFPEYYSLEPKQEYIIKKIGSTTLGKIAKIYGLPLNLVKSLNRHADPRYKLPADARIVLPYGSELKPKAEKPVYRAKKSDPVKAYHRKNYNSQNTGNH